MFKFSYYGPTTGNLIGAGLYLTPYGSLAILGLSALNLPKILCTEILTGYQCANLLQLGIKKMPKLLLGDGYQLASINGHRCPGDLWELATNIFIILQADITVSIANAITEWDGSNLLSGINEAFSNWYNVVN
ncbi:MAG: hypothetical protein AABY27_01460 [Pseudomonadota bacterium]